MCRIAKLSKLTVPKFIMDALAPIHENEEAVSNFGVAFATDMCKKLLDSGLAPSLHMYTLNREASTRLVCVLQEIYK